MDIPDVSLSDFLLPVMVPATAEQVQALQHRLDEHMGRSRLMLENAKKLLEDAAKLRLEIYNEETRTGVQYGTVSVLRLRPITGQNRYPFTAESHPTYEPEITRE